MSSFLHDIANLLVANYGDEALRFNYVFPNRRSALFFRQHLGKAVGHAFFSPQWFTIDELFQQLAESLPVPLKKADSLTLQFILYEEYCKVSKNPSSIDDFLYWGKIILADFNEIDVSMVNANDVLSNIKALHDIDKAMSAPEQAYQDFWDELIPLYNNLRERLLKQNLAYSGMLQRSVVEQLPLLEDSLKAQRPYIFIGLNAISEAEEQLLKHLQTHFNADFYWDYSSQLFKDNKTAALFLKHNIETFPSKLQYREPCSVTFSGDINLVSVPSDIGQTLVVSKLLEDNIGDAESPQHEGYPYPTHTPHPELVSGSHNYQLRIENSQSTWAVVLPEEQMLLPMMNAIPDSVSKVNITMGYPMRLTQIHSFVTTLLGMLWHSICKEGIVQYYHTEVTELLSHPYLRRAYNEQCMALSADIEKNNRVYVDSALLQDLTILNEIIAYHSQHPEKVVTDTVISLLLDLIDQVPTETAQEREQIVRYHRLIAQIQALWQQFSSSVKEMSLNLFLSILQNLVSSATIPFEGEPLGGLQLMGVLETRALSFDNLVILSVNDDVFPQKSASQSFITYSVRRHFHMATHEKQDAISAYNFYRLISHAKHVWLVYNSDNSGQKSGEVSRFVRQLDYQFQIPIRTLTASTSLFTHLAETLSLKKTDIVWQKVQEYLLPDNPYTHRARGLSPSALKTYCKCPLQFALQYILSFKPQDEVQDEIQDNIFGDIAHALLEHLYEPFVDRDVTATALKEVIKNLPLTLPRLLPEVDKKHLVDPIAEKALYHYVEAILRYDMANAPFHYLGSEVENETTINLCQKSKVESRKTQPHAEDAQHLPDSVDCVRVKLQGKIDRLDRHAERLRIIDYKTGMEPPSPPTKMEGVFSKDNFVIQTLFYCALLEKEATLLMQPHIYYFREISKDPHYDTAVKWDSETGVLDYTTDVREAFHAGLKQCLSDMLDQTKDFVASPSYDNCKYCPYKAICQTV